MSMRTTKTKANLMSARYGDDGLRSVDADGIGIEDALEDAGATRDYSQERDAIRYSFDDGSSIVVAGGSWDLGHPSGCHCWEGAPGEHEPGCDLSGEVLHAR